MPSIPATAMNSVQVNGPFWSADLQVLELADPQSNWAVRSLFLDLMPRSRLGQNQMLLPGTLILLGWARQVTLQPREGISYTWSQQVTLPASLSPDLLRHHIGQGDLSLLLVQTDADAWPAQFPRGANDDFFPPLTCLNGSIALDRGADETPNPQTIALYEALGLALPTVADHQQRRDRLAAGETQTRLLSNLSVHSSGLSIYGAIQLPWQPTAIALPLQVAQRRPDQQRFRISLERDRLTQPERQALQTAWSSLSQALNPLNPLNPPLETPPVVPNWVTLEITNPQAVPSLIWEVAAWGNPPRLHLPADEMILLLSDQPPSSQTHPPTSLAQVVPQTVAVQLTDPDTLELSIEAAAEPDRPDGDESTLTYSAMWETEPQVWQETIRLDKLTTTFDPVDVPRFLRSRLGQPRPTWQGEGSQTIDPPILWGFMPLEDGWAQLPILNLTEQIYLDSRVVRPQENQDTPPSALLQGAVSLGNHQPLLRANHRHEQPWNLTLTHSQSVSGRWRLTRLGDQDWTLEQVTLTLTQPQLTLNGLFWLSTGQPRVQDALPDWDDWVDGVRSHALKTVDPASDRFPSALVFSIEQLTLACRRTPDLPTSAQLQEWQFTYEVDERDRSWSEEDGSTTQTDLFQRFIDLQVLPESTFQAALPLLWRRHAALPMVQALPLTQSQSPPNYPSASRQLIPYELPVVAHRPQQWTFGVTHDQGAAAWPQVQSPVSLAQEWQELSDLPWVSLSLPGLVLEPQDPTTLVPIYHHDLPYTDQIQALAQLPVIPEDPEATSPLPDSEPPALPKPLTRDSFADHWQTLSTLASLAQGDGTIAFTADQDNVSVHGLVEPFDWPVDLSLNLAAYPGRIELHNGLNLELTGEAALAGISGRFQLQDGVLRGVTDEEISEDLDENTNVYQITAGSLAAHAEQGGLRDQRGWTRWATVQRDRLLRSPLTLQQADQTVTYALTSSLDPLSLAVGSHTWQFWFRDVPLLADSQRFDRDRTRSPIAQELQSDINDPEARSQLYNALNGYEWRLGNSISHAYLDLMGLHFYPLTLEVVQVDQDRVTGVEIIGRLQLPLSVPTGELEDVSNAVRLSFSRSEDGLFLSDLSLEAPVRDGAADEPLESPVSNGATDAALAMAHWPLALTDGELSNAPMLTWSSIRLGERDGAPVIQLGDADTGEAGQVWLQFVLFEQLWSVPLGVVQLPTAPLTFNFPMPAEMTHLAPEWVRVDLDLNDYRHQVILQLEVQVGRQQVAVPQTAFLAKVQFDLLQDTQTWAASDFFFGDLEGSAESQIVVVRPGTLQFQWQGYQVPDSAEANLVQLLPGMHLQHSDQAPGYTALTFTTEPQTPPSDSRMQVSTLRLETAFMELVLFCQWGDFLQQPGVTQGSRSLLYASSAGDITVGYTARWEPDPDKERWEGTWVESLLLNGLLEIRNLLSWPLAMDLSAGDDPQTVLTLPATIQDGIPQPLDHLRHTAQILFNQHNLPADMLRPGQDELLFELVEDRPWQFLAVVEHQIINVLPQSADLSSHRLEGDRRWTVTQMVQMGTPAQLRDALLAQSDRHTLDAGTGIRSLGQALGGTLGTDLRDHLATGDQAALDRLAPHTLLVDLSSPYWIRQTPLRTGNGTVLQFLPNGAQLAIPSNPQDYSGSDPQDPLWLLLTLPFLGRLQAQQQDFAPVAQSTLHIDPIVLLSQDPSHPLARLLASRGDQEPIDVAIASLDTAVGRTWPRLDPLSLEESWFRLQHPQREPIVDDLQSVMATRPEAAARLSRATALQQAVNVLRQTYPPQVSPEPPPNVPPSLLVIPQLDASGLQVLYDFIPSSNPGIVRDKSGLSPALDLTIQDSDRVTWLEDGGLRLQAHTLIRSATVPQRLIDACRETDAITVEVWITLAPDQLVQPGQGPKRIITLSVDQGVRYFTLGQGLTSGLPGAVYNARLRTAGTDNNAVPGLTSPDKTAIAGLSQIVYTRDRQGQARLYINGVEQASANLPGELFPQRGPRDAEFRLALGDELNGGRAWLGDYRRLALYNRAFSVQEVRRRYQVGVERLRESSQQPTAWHITGLQLRSSKLWTQTDASHRYAAATQLPALLNLQGQANPLPVSLAVSPYLGLEFRPARGEYHPHLISTELLCLSLDAQQLRPVANHLWDVLPNEAEALPTRILTWAQQTHLRLSPNSAIAILRYRVINRPDQENLEEAIAPLTATYRFQVVTDLSLPEQLTRRVFQLRSAVKHLRFRQGQFGGVAMPVEEVKPVDLAPPQVVGIQPIYLTERPDSSEPGTWPWGLSALRLSVHYTQDQAGMVGNLQPQATRWWQAPHYQTQFRSAVGSDRPTAGLPPYFRAQAIQSLLPSASQAIVPPMEDETTENQLWQPVLPGSLRYVLTGDRAGLFLTLRHHIIRQEPQTDSVLRSGSVPVQHRIPRPVPLPDNLYPNTALQTWAHYFQINQGATIRTTPSDNAFFAASIDKDKLLIQPAQGLEMILESPWQGQIGVEWDGMVRFSIHNLGDVAAGITDWTINIQLNIGDRILRYTALDIASGTYALQSPTDDQTPSLQDLLRDRKSGDRLVLEARVTPPSASGMTGFHQVLSFPLRITDPDRIPLPLEPYFIQFEDPEYNRQLASSAGHATQELLIPAAGQSEPVSHSVQLSCDRTEYNPDSSLAIRYDWDDKADGKATLSINWIRNGVPTPLQPKTISLTDLAAKELLQFSLAELVYRDESDRPATLLPGNTLEFQLMVQDKGKEERAIALLAPKPVVLTVEIVAQPVIPAPEAAYALLRQRHPSQVECVRFAWGPVPSRIELIRADDLRTEIVRRRAVFQWIDATRPAIPGAASTQYAIQKITQTGSTHLPPMGS